MKPIVDLQNVVKHFGLTRALAGVSLDVQPGEFVVVIGPTGAGKTTLLRVIAGLEHPDSGTLLMEGQDARQMSPAERDTAVVFQNFSLYPNRTVRDNLAFPLKAPGRSLNGDEIEDRVRSTAGLLKIDHLLDRPSSHLSGGEMQRVAIGRAIVRRPRIFLMDEPLTNLDARLREDLRTEIVALQRTLDTPTLFVTHDDVEALSMADRLFVLDEGRVVQSGTPEDVYQRPNSPRVARQLGSPRINILPFHTASGKLTTGGGEPICALPSVIPRDARSVGIRPEAISPTGGTIATTIVGTESLGHSQILFAKWGGHTVHLTAPTSSSFAPGDTIYPSVDPDRLVIWTEDIQKPVNREADLA